MFLWNGVYSGLVITIQQGHRVILYTYAVGVSRSQLIKGAEGSEIISGDRARFASGRGSLLIDIVGVLISTREIADLISHFP